MLQTLPVSSNSEVLIMCTRRFAIYQLVNNKYTQGRRNSIIAGEAAQVKERTRGGKFQIITLVIL